MGVQDFFNWRSQAATANMPATEDDDLTADVDEPPDCTEKRTTEFHKATVRPQSPKKESLLTKALQTSPESDSVRPEVHVKTDLFRRRSLMSNASIASTADLTSDGGFTSPDRTNTPSPPFPNTTYTSFAPFSLGQKPTNPVSPPIVTAEMRDPAVTATHDIVTVSPKATPAVEPPKRRCITFACGTQKPKAAPTSQPVQDNKVEEPPRPRCIKFACPAKPSEKAKAEREKAHQPKTVEVSKPTEQRRSSSGRSPSLTRKIRPQSSSNSRSHRDSTGTVRRASQSPVAVRISKPKYIVASESDLQSSEATRFNEFASEQLQEDDWIRKDAEEDLVRMKKLTIKDTLMKENAIRQLGTEAEEEALEEDEEEDGHDNGYDSDDENIDDDEDEDDDDLTFNGSDDEDDASDGNETDNEAGFADSDDESDGDGYQFWTPGRTGHNGEVSTYRASAHRTASTSSIDSLEHLRPIKEANDSRRSKPSRRIKIRPGTPDLPDSTDFVCGTLDEDRPLEDAYISCMKARKFHGKVIPQDIDPSFPTSDPEDEEDENDVIETANDSEEHVWIHGKFEDSDSERYGRRRSTAQGHSPRRLRSPPPPKRLHSPPPPKRLHSPPPPAKRRLHSPPPRKLFGHSPKRMHSPAPAPTIQSPTASPTEHATSAAITFAQLGSRAGITHTKSLPRTPNAFCRQYRASRLAAANGNDPEDSNDAHIRGAIDIVKGLEQKRQRRKEKFYQKQCNRARKGQPERKPQPGKGAERMRELGLLMAGKLGQDQNPNYILSA